MIRLSVVIVFHNMRREARRTLHSLSVAYQKEVTEGDYEVIVVDNGSSEPLDGDWVRGHGRNFRYIYFDTDSPSPAAGMNYGVTQSTGDLVACCVDGARILTPGVVRYMCVASGLYPHPFVYTLGMHLGSRPQNYTVVDGYDEATEDALVASVDWPGNGYSLFTISAVAHSSGRGYFSRLSESNCFAVTREDYDTLGRFDERFLSPGGGLVNLDFFNKVHADERYAPIMLLGEATFHQVHGGVATNVAMEHHPFEKMKTEYEQIKTTAYAVVHRQPEYLGRVNGECLSLLISELSGGDRP